MPRMSRMRTRASPILLFGVEAPAVIPNSNGPAGSHSDSVTSGAEASSTGLCRITPDSTSMQCASSMWNVRVYCLQRCARWLVFDEFYPPITSMTFGGVFIIAATAS